MIDGLQGRPLLGLVACVVAVLAWVSADGWRNKLLELDRRKATAVRLLSRDFQGPDAGLNDALTTASKQREALTHRLAVEEPLETSRARVYYEIKEHCKASGLSCEVRLADVSRSGTAAAAPVEPGSLEALGVYSVLARVAGTVGERDITFLLGSLSGDPAGQWRVKQVQVRGRGFELEVERHLIPDMASKAPKRHG